MRIKAITIIVLCFPGIGFAQQWSGSSDVNGTISRNGNITAYGLGFGRYGGGLHGDSNPYQIYSFDNENHDLTVYGSSSATLNLRLYDGDLKIGYNSTPFTTLFNNGSASFGGTVSVNGNLNLAGVAGRRLYMGGVGGATFGIAYDANYPDHGIFYTEGNPDYVSVSPNGGGNNGVLNVFGSGLVGIGTLSPYSSSRLHAKAQTGGPWTFMSEAQTNDRVVGIGHDGNSGVVAVSYLSTGGWSPLELRTQNVARLTVGVDGNIGVGTSSPINKLQIGPNAQGYNGNELVLSNSHGGLAIYTDASNTVLHGSHGISVRPGNGQLAIYAKSDGNVGIGTTSPDQKLTVNGNIHAKEVKVDLSVPGPDYVFDEDYPLTSLDDLKKYIDEHRHLPEVPSAKEMEANGINLMEMNVMLLKKVEELTLHVIELKEQLKDQQKQIDVLKKN